MLNSVISTVNGRFMTGDLKDFYLGTPMTEYEYMRIPISMIPPAIMEHYQLTPLIHNGHVYVEIRKGMYGLPQAGILANDRLAEFLKPHGYSPVLTGLWRHASRPIAFTLVVDDFGVKYTRREDAEHLMNSSAYNTPSRRIGPARDTAASRSTGTIPEAPSIYPFPATLHGHLNASNTTPTVAQHSPMRISSPPLVPSNSSHHCRMHHLP
ncbi:Reverse transcriptase (RNA-dependent DNA polymerase) [Fragilaria crotonensis]|nr:Reverse transcriptase (RNA-dependent DNA polymerase) [Fragilaria crotonensis]